MTCTGWPWTNSVSARRSSEDVSADDHDAHGTNGGHFAEPGETPDFAATSSKIRRRPR